MIDDPRTATMRSWLSAIAEEFSLSLDTLSVASADASFRRYFRISSAQGKTYIVMDAPPAHEDTERFLKVADLLKHAGLHSPSVESKNIQDGYLLLEDLGDAIYLSLLNQTTADALYKDAIAAIVQMQAKVRTDSLPAYDRAQLLREMQLYPDWYVSRHRQKQLTPSEQKALTQAFELILRNNLAQPRAFVHRDFHSRNLLLVKQNSPGIIDFQDAVVGPLTYDLVSLLKDAYIRWEEDQVLDWAIRYWEQARKAGLPVAEEFGNFYRDFEWMGLQRHLKVLGIFARLNYRDGKSRYLADLPLVLDYCLKVCNRYAELSGLKGLMLSVEGSAEKVGYTF